MKIRLAHDSVELDDEHILLNQQVEPGDLDGLLDVLASVVVRLATAPSCITPATEAAG